MMEVRKPGFLRTIPLLITIFSLSFPTFAKYSGGTGEPNDPYQIATAEELMLLGDSPNDYGRHFILTADIDLDPNLPGRKVFNEAVVGPFTGTFDGNGHTISHLTIEGESMLGLFGGLLYGAVVKDLGMVDVNITGSDNHVGGLVGWNSGMWRFIPHGHIIKCYSTGSVIGSKAVGGLVGYNDGHVTDCYSTVAVNGIENIGGLVGNNGGHVANCYSRGTVNGTESVGGLTGGNYWDGEIWGRSGSLIQCCSSSSVIGGKDVGGLLGYNNGEVADCYSTGAVSGIENVGGLVGTTDLISTITNCYAIGSVLGDNQVGGLLGNNLYEVTNSFWDTETSGLMNMCGSQSGDFASGCDNKYGKTTADMQKPDIFMDAGWDFVGQPDGPHDIWAIPIGGGYPILWWQISLPTALPAFSGGTGEPDNPYLISTADELNSIGHNPRLMAAHFKLLNDIDLAGIGFYIIGSETVPFTGVFDGNGKKISNFTYTAKERDFVGFFRCVVGATIKDLGLIKPAVHAHAGTGFADGAGSLAGYLGDGTISNCYAEGGSVWGDAAVGGLVGALGDAIMTDCFTLDMNVSGYAGVGGLVGGSFFGMIIQSYSSGCIVFGELRVGGLVGVNESTIANCYATCKVSGSEDIGGLAGENIRGSITSSYSTSSVSGDQSVGGLVGDNNVSGSITSSYSTSRVSGNRHVGGLVGHNVSSIANSYSTGMVSGNWYVGGFVGGFVGFVGIGSEEDVSNCFWDIQTSTIHESNGGTGLTTEEMQRFDTYLSAGWDFVGQQDGPNDIWAVPIGGGYPILRWQTSLPPELPAFSGGTGEPDNPYLISTADELNSIGRNPGLMAAHFKLTNDIDLTGINFHIIGSETVPFTGVFDGNGKKISNFTYTATERDFVGFFRYVDGATIKDLGLINPNFDAGTEWDTFWLLSYGSLVGYLKDGTISNCYAESGSVSGSVFGDPVVGGLVGANEGTIANCYSTASVLGSFSVGGLVGFNLGTITNCYATGSISGYYVGGLVGSNAGTVYNSFWDIEISGQVESAGGEGKTTIEMQMASTFLDAGWDFVDEIANGTEDIWWIDEGQDYPRLWWEMIPEN